MPIPKPGFLDTCEYLGYIHGERRWRGRRGLPYTWDALHGEIEAFSAQGHLRGALDGETGAEIKPARKGRRIRV
ncbi:MAG: colicin E3/pyocin S6 family cytotoxin [Acetobacteraceae bacterium]